MVCSNNARWKNAVFHSGLLLAVGQPTQSAATHPSRCHHRLCCFYQSFSKPAGEANGGCSGDRWRVAEGVKKTKKKNYSDLIPGNGNQGGRKKPRTNRSEGERVLDHKQARRRIINLLKRVDVFQWVRRARRESPERKKTKKNIWILCTRWLGLVMTYMGSSIHKLLHHSARKPSAD